MCRIWLNAIAGRSRAARIESVQNDAEDAAVIAQLQFGRDEIADQKATGGECAGDR